VSILSRALPFKTVRKPKCQQARCADRDGRINRSDYSNGALLPDAALATRAKSRNSIRQKSDVETVFDSGGGNLVRVASLGHDALSG